jgi:hypothetical protein
VVRRGRPASRARRTNDACAAQHQEHIVPELTSSLRAAFFCVALTATTGVQGQGAQGTGAAPAAPTPVMPMQSPAAAPGGSTLSEDPRNVAMAQALNPVHYGRAFYTGAQAELVVPDAGISSMLFGYDLIWMQADLSLGLGVGGDPITGDDAAGTYIMAARFAFPIHRGVRSDFALSAGVGTTIINPPRADNIVLGTGAVGAKFRVFMTPSVAVGATLGLGAFIRGDSSSLVMGARPLGSASVVYFFR